MSEGYVAIVVREVIGYTDPHGDWETLTPFDAEDRAFHEEEGSKFFWSVCGQMEDGTEDFLGDHDTEEAANRVRDRILNANLAGCKL